MQTLQVVQPVVDSQLTAAGLVEHDVVQQAGVDLRVEYPPEVAGEPVPPGLLLPLNLLELRAGQLKGVGQQPLFLRRVFLRVPLSLAALLLLLPRRLGDVQCGLPMGGSLPSQPTRHAIPAGRVDKLPVRGRRRHLLANDSSPIVELVVGHLHLRLGLHEPPALTVKPIRLLPSLRVLVGPRARLLLLLLQLALAHDVHPRVRLVLHLW